MPIASTLAVTPEQQAMAAAIRDWASRAATIAAVRALEPDPAPAAPARAAGGLPASWAGLAGLGVFSIAVPEAAGGSGGSVADLSVAAAELAAALVPGPVLPTLLASLALTGPPPAAAALLSALAAGRAPVAVALTAGTLAAQRLDDGSLRVRGRTGPVLGAGPGITHLLLAAAVGGTGSGRDAWFLAEPCQPGVELTARQPVDFSRPLADIELTGAIIHPDRFLPGLRTGRLRDLAATLFAAEAAAVARWCTETAVAHARARHQFGRPIGAFQAVKHLCAGMLCRAERSAALAWDAARAADEAPDEHPLAAAAAAAVALDAAVDNAKDCIQVLGGIGFTWEHDAHLYLRRALALRSLLGGSAAWQARTAELALSGARRRLALAAPSPSVPAGTPAGGRRADPVAVAARAAAVRIAALPASRQRAALADSGYAAPHWPAPYGLDTSAADLLVIDEELSRAGLARPDLVIGGWAMPAIIGHGTREQLDRFAGPTLRGEITWCQLFSEPEAGSDLASLRTRAERDADGGGWRLTGQKLWTSLAGQAGWAICLARTDPGAQPRHRGLTFFLVDMHAAGIEIRPLREITGRAAFNEVFLDGVLVPDDCVVGRPGDGWRIARGALAVERVAMGRGSALGGPAEDLLAAVAAAALGADPAVAQQVGALVADGLAGSVLDLRAVLAQRDGAEPGAESAVRKLAGIAHRQAVAEAALTLCGADGAAADGAAAAAVHDFLLTRCLSIAGGTTQILLSVVAERALGLPREEAR